MPLIYLDDIRLNARLDGPKGAPALVLLPSLGADLAVWDALLPHLPAGLQLLRLDMRGHGGSDCPPAPYAMGKLIHDVERLIDHFALRDTVILGHGSGGLVAQGLATKRLDQVRALILSNTAARLGHASQWQARIATATSGGLEALAPALVQGWFSPRMRLSPLAAATRDRLLATPLQGWCGTAAAIAGADFYTTTAALTLPALVLAGANDGLCPPDLVRETAELMLGHDFRLMRGTGHFPFLEAPEAFAGHLATFLRNIGHA